MKTETQSNEKICDFCSKKFCSQSSLGQHMKSVHLGFRFHCEKCDKTFSQKPSLKRHLRTIHHNKIKSTSEIDDEIKSSAYIPDKACVVENKQRRHRPFVEKGQPNDSLERNTCRQCGKAFATLANLKRHVRDVHGKIEHKCNQCSKTFATRFSLRRHEANAHDHIDSACEVCKQVFKTRKELAQHQLKAHKKLASNLGHQCAVCQRVFIYKSNLTRHTLLYHREGLPHQCSICRYGFKSQDLLAKHNAKFHKRKSSRRRKTRKMEPISAFLMRKELSNQEFAKIIANRYRRQRAGSKRARIRNKEQHNSSSRIKCKELDLSLKLCKDGQSDAKTEKHNNHVQRPKSLELFPHGPRKQRNRNSLILNPSSYAITLNESLTIQSQSVNDQKLHRKHRNSKPLIPNQSSSICSTYQSMTIPNQAVNDGKLQMRLVSNTSSITPSQAIAQIPHLSKFTQLQHQNLHSITSTIPQVQPVPNPQYKPPEFVKQTEQIISAKTQEPKFGARDMVLPNALQNKIITQIKIPPNTTSQKSDPISLQSFNLFIPEEPLTPTVPPFLMPSITNEPPLVVPDVDPLVPIVDPAMLSPLNLSFDLLKSNEVNDLSVPATLHTPVIPDLEETRQQPMPEQDAVDLNVKSHEQSVNGECIKSLHTPEMRVPGGTLETPVLNLVDSSHTSDVLNIPTEIGQEDLLSHRLLCSETDLFCSNQLPVLSPLLPHNEIINHNPLEKPY